jgi:hypothetical protein
LGGRKERGFVDERTGRGFAYRWREVGESGRRFRWLCVGAETAVNDHGDGDGDVWGLRGFDFLCTCV